MSQPFTFVDVVMDVLVGPPPRVRFRTAAAMYGVEEGEHALALTSALHAAEDSGEPVAVTVRATTIVGIGPAT